MGDDSDIFDSIFQSEMLDFWLLDARILVFYIFIFFWMYIENTLIDEGIGEMVDQKKLQNCAEIFNKKLSVEDQKLYELCKKYGAHALSARRKFAGLLPEVLRRRLYQKKGFKSVFEFAAKLAGMSQEQVRLVLNLEKRFEDKPVLKSLLVGGEVSVNKLARVVSIATVENQAAIADKIMVLPKSALEVWVRDEKVACWRGENNELGQDGFGEKCGDSNGLQESIFGGESLPGQTLDLNFEISTDIKKELNELHSKGIDVNEFLRRMLEQRKKDIAQEKEDISVQNIGKAPQKTSRYIPVRIKKILKAEFGEKCSIHTCVKPSKQIHHTQRFSLSRNHDAKYLAPLCVEHHTIAHSIDLKFYRVRQKITA